MERDEAQKIAVEEFNAILANNCSPACKYRAEVMTGSHASLVDRLVATAMAISIESRLPWPPFKEGPLWEELKRLGLLREDP